MKKHEHKSLTLNVIQALTLIVFILLPFGQLQRLQITPTISTYSHEIILAVSVILWICYQITSKTKRTKSVLEKPFLVFIGFALFSWLINFTRFGTPSLPGLLYLLRVSFYFGFYLLLNDFRHKKLLSFKIEFILTLVGVLLVLFSWLQYTVIPDTRFLYLIGWDDHLFRAIGTLFDPGFLGLIFVLTLILIEDKFNQDLFKIIYIATFLIMLLTYARSAYFAFIIAALAHFSISKDWKRLIVKIFILFFALPLLPRPAGEGVRLERTSSIYSRAQTAVSSMDIFKSNPIFGIGFNNYPLAAPTQPNLKYPDLPSHPSAPDNSFLFILATTGIIGLISFLYFLGKTIILTHPYPTSFISIITILAHSFTNNSFFYPWILLWFWAILASRNLKGFKG